MKASKIYFILTVIFNSLFWLIIVAKKGGVFSVPFGYEQWGLLKLSDIIPVFIALISLIFALFSLLFGIWILLFEKKVAKRIVIICIIISAATIIYAMSAVIYEIYIA